MYLNLFVIYLFASNLTNPNYSQILEFILIGFLLSFLFKFPLNHSLFLLPILSDLFNIITN